MMVHDTHHPRAGERVAIIDGYVSGHEILIEDWWDRIAGRSWMNCDGNPACLEYAITSCAPIDDEVIYGKVGGLGKLVHISQLAATA